MTALGFRVKSGRAIAVVLTGTAAEPTPAGRTVVELCDPDVEETRQPYHSGFGQAEEDRQEIARRVQIVERVARTSVAALLRTHDVTKTCRAGLVVGSVIDPASVANPHIRAHANEGRLFRVVVEKALAGKGIDASVIVERELRDSARARLRISDRQLDQRLDAFGKALGRPWRADEKAAALAAWMSLAVRNV
ncbi:MAG TPA: hypothetical protein VH583_21210 [Vicinamibacterales bacterium]|jgi:hypothetical protein